MSLKYVQSLTLYQAGAGNIIGATTVVLTSLTDIYGNAITTMTPFGAKGYITLEPDTTNEEGATFTGITVNANGTVSLTGISTILAQSPYSESSGLVRQHSGGTKVVVTDNVAFWNTFANINNDQTFAGANSFTQKVGVGAVTSSDLGKAATVDFVNATAVAGAPNASATVKGIVQEATQAQVLAKTAVGSTGAELYINPLTLPSTLLSDYKVDTGSANAYAIAPAPAIAAYVVGQIFSFKATHANTTASTLAVSGLTAQTIKNAKAGDLVANDILNGQIVVVEYDGTNFQMISPLGNEVSLSGGAYPAGNGSAITNVNVGQVVSSQTSGPSLTLGQALTMGLYQSDGGILLDVAAVQTSNSSSFTVANNANRILVVIANVPTNGATINSATYNGVSMTRVDSESSGGANGSSASFYLVAPATGTNTLAFSLSAGIVAAGVYSFYNAAQTGQPEAHNAAASPTATSVSVSTIAPGAVVIGGGGAQPTSGNGFYADKLSNTNVASSDSGQVFTSGTSITFTASNSSNTQALVALSIVPFTVPVLAAQLASSATPTINQFTNLYKGFFGFAGSSVSANSTVPVIVGGVVTGLSGLTAGSQYYLNDTLGTIGLSPGTNSRKVGVALSATTLLVTNIW